MGVSFWSETYRINMKCILALLVLAGFVGISLAGSVSSNRRNLMDCVISDFVFCAGHGHCVTYVDPDNANKWVHACQCDTCYHGKHCTKKTDLYDCMTLPEVLPAAADLANEASTLLDQGVAPETV